MAWENLSAEVAELFEPLQVPWLKETKGMTFIVTDSLPSTGEGQEGWWRKHDESFYRELGHKRALARQGVSEDEFTARRLKMINLFNDGKTLADIAAEMGMKRTGVKSALNKLGLKGRPGRRAK